MFPLVIALVLVMNEATVSSVNGEGCSSVNTTFGPVINMCEDGSWRLGVVYVSVTPTNMGSSASCGCTMSGQVQGQDITTNFQLERSDPSIQSCAHTVLTVRRPGALQNFTCVTQVTLVTLNSTDIITITLSRELVLSRTSLCLSIIPLNHAENNILLTCGGGAKTSTASSTSPDPTTTPSTSTSTTPSAPSTVSEVSTSATSTAAPSTAPAANTGEMTSSTDEMTSNTEPPMTRKGDQEPKDKKTDLIPPVVGGVVGGSAMTVIVIVLIVVYMRKKQQNYPPREETPGVCSVGSEDVLTYNALYESSSVHARNQPLQASQPGPTNGREVYRNVCDNLVGPSVADNNTSSDQARFSMGTATVATATAGHPAVAAAAPAAAASAAACQPPSNEYAVVNKPGRRQKRDDSRSATVTSRSTNVTLPSGDIYAVVDKSRAPR